MIDLTATDLTTKTAVELRKIGAEAGVKGASKGKKAELLAALLPIQDAQRAVKHAETQAKVATAQADSKPAKKSNKCRICNDRRMYTGPGEKAPRLSEACNPCYAEGSWKNAHSDNGHDEIQATPEAERTSEQLNEIAGCWICFPELNLVQRSARTGQSRVGMVIVAKGSEVHKSATFKAAAEAAGWSVKVMDTFEVTEGNQARYVATATKGNDTIELSWNGRAYDYPNSSASLGGKVRKVRNLKEAIRFL